ncbi:MAG: PL29 family lyase N-terminal domain-containing protein, partial [Bacteroidales bacterium]|nr:PL29 family lyase N-terminal domain-containing protein [Bacteroidales bacterium]
MKGKWMAMSLFMGALLTSCNTASNDLWDALDKVDLRVTALEETISNANTNLGTLQKLLDAMEHQVFIESVIDTDDQCLIQFSDGKVVAIKKGSGSSEGTTVAAPTISAKQDTDGKYYWTVNNNWLMVNGAKVPTTGE